MTVSGTSNKLDLSGCGGEEDENLSSVKELLLDVEGAQESQRTGLRLNGAKGVNTDNSSSSVYSRSDGSTSEPGEKHYPLGPLRISVAGSEAEYDSWNPRSQIPVLTDDIYLGISSFAKRRKISFLILLLRFLLCFSRRYTIHTSASKISSLITPMGGRRKGTKVQAAVQTILSLTLSDRLLRDGAQHTLRRPSLRQPPAPSIFEVPPSAQQTVQV